MIQNQQASKALSLSFKSCLSLSKTLHCLRQSFNSAPAMAAKNHPDRKIPVFTVLKNGAVLKNIFIVNKPPEPVSVSDPLSESVASLQDYEDILLVGRHPDCDIMLTHPSISRFHLQIHSNPSSQSLSVVDLSSVHGTWVSERKLDPGVSVELKEGDTLRIGVSSRVYRLHWIPITRAYDLENPFVSESDVVVEAENGEEDAVPEEVEEAAAAEIVENLNFCPVEIEEIQSVDSILESVEFINSGVLDENLDLIVKKEIPSAPPMPEDIISFCCDEEWESQSIETFGVPSDPFGTETSYLPITSVSENKLCDSQNPFLSPTYVESVVECDNTVKIEAYPEVEMAVGEAVQETKMRQFHTPPDTFTSPLSPGVVDSFEKHWYSLLINIDPASFDEKSAASAAVIPHEFEFGCTLRDNDRNRVEDIFTAGAGIFTSEITSLPVEDVIPDTKFQQIKVVEEVAVDSLSDGEKEDKCGEEYKSKLHADLNAESCHEQGHSVDDIVQDIGNNCTGSICPLSLQVESVNSSVPQEAVLKITNKKENQTPQSLIAVARCSEMEILQSREEATEKNSTFGNIWSRRGKAASAPQIRTSKSICKNTAKVDTEVEMSNEKDIVNKTISNDLFSVLNEEEEETFTPDKENFSPNTLQLRFLKKKGKLEEIKHSKSQRSHNSKANNSPNIYPDESISPTSNKENQSPKVAQEYKLRRKPFGCHRKEYQSPKVTQEYKSQRKPFGSHMKLAQEEESMALKSRVERVPFESLMNSGGKSRSGIEGPVSAGKSMDASNCGQILEKHINPYYHISGEPKRSWDMIVDTASLLNKESRKALQLLQGLKGTRLIIPRLVLRELDSVKRQFTIFRRISEASLALEWIEECMAKTRWWIHIQSSMEEERLIAPTPPASPQTQFSEEGWTFPSLSSHKSSMEIASPTVEDHMLDYALLYRRKHNGGQLILLSDDVTLKIKCMAEGLPCEPVQEFRESLVNPFSERFLWTNSSPRGLTWSCQDDVVLREKYCHLPSRKSSKGARGLKLILLHNSQYGH